jgi:hypothetical protein
MNKRELIQKEAPLSLAARLLGGRTQELAYAFSDPDDRLQGPAPKSPHAGWIGKLIIGAWVIWSLYASMNFPLQTALVLSGAGLLGGIALALLIGTIIHWSAYQ